MGFCFSDVSQAKRGFILCVHLCCIFLCVLCSKDPFGVVSAFLTTEYTELHTESTEKNYF